jgi:hypothetical protein
MAAGVAVLDVEHRIVLGLLDHLGEVEIQHRVVLAEQHHEAHGVGADLVDDLAQVTKSPERFDIFTGSPLRSSLTSCTILTSSAPCPR